VDGSVALPAMPGLSHLRQMLGTALDTGAWRGVARRAQCPGCGITWLDKRWFLVT